MLFNLFADTELSLLRQQLKISRRAAYSEGTQRNHRTQWRTYLSFCHYFSLVSLPATLDTICLFCQFLSQSLAPSSIRNYVSGVKSLHVLAGFEFSHTNSFQLRLTLKGIERLAQHCPNKAPPVTPSILSQFASVCDLSSVRDRVFFTLSLFAFFLFARLGNLVPESLSGFDPVKHLRRKDVVSAPHGLIVTFSHTKTIQFGQRRLSIPLLSIPGSSLCPVSSFAQMCRLVPAEPNSPAFVIPVSGSHKLVPVFKSQFVQYFRLMLQRAGNSHYYSYRGHSFRRGGASWAYSVGVPGELIQIFGDWASDAYKGYLDLSFEAKLDLASRISAPLHRS